MSRRSLRRRGRPVLAGLLAGSVAGFLAAAGVFAGAPANGYWQDQATVTSGTFTTWGVTNVSCPDPAWGTAHRLSWTAPAGSSSVATLTVSPSPSGLSSWASTFRPGTPDTDGSPAEWGITTSNLFETTQFNGTWTLVVTPPAPTGGWTATRTGTWTLHYTSSTSGTNTCSVNP